MARHRSCLGSRSPPRRKLYFFLSAAGPPPLFCPSRASAAAPRRAEPTAEEGGARLSGGRFEGLLTASARGRRLCPIVGHGMVAARGPGGAGGCRAGPEPRPPSAALLRRPPGGPSAA